MAYGKIIYYTDGVTPTTYNFEQNFSYGEQISRLDLTSRKRALDGTAYSTTAALKGVWVLEFSGAPLTQWTAFLAAYDSGYSFELYLDGATAKTADVIFSSPPVRESQPYFISGNPSYNFTVELEEI